MACLEQRKFKKGHVHTTSHIGSCFGCHFTRPIIVNNSCVIRSHHYLLVRSRRRNVAKLASSSDSLSGRDSTGPSDVVRNLARQYFFVQNPALANRLYSKAVQDFTESAVLAYECGHNEKDVDEQLGQLSEEDLKQLKDFDAAECVAMVCLVWITLMLSPRTVRRWATSAPVSETTLSQWRGFVAMIVNGYFERRMAWFPLDRLQLELSAVQGRSMPPELVAERARVVYTTLEQVYPQFAKD